MGLIPDLTIENQLLPLAKPLGVIDIKNLLRRNAVKFDLEERLVKNPAAGIGKELDHTRILTRVNGHRLGFFQDAVNERQYAAARAAAEAAAAEEAAKQAAENKAARQANGEPASFISADGVSIEGGAAMALLMRKIRLFEQLIEKQELQKAAVVARDVDMLVQHFDPITFLPKVFVPFFRLMSRNMQHLEPAMAALDMPLFKSLVQLYHADLDAFAES